MEFAKKIQSIENDMNFLIVHLKIFCKMKMI